ncbi:MAG: pirin family protein [Puniceicoccaceae bacterium]
MQRNTLNTVYRGEERGSTDLGWLKSWHSFSFGSFQNPNRMGFGPLRVINDDRVEGGRGFGAHPHRDMEIISLVYSGQLQHRDNLGNGDLLEAGDVQYMSAGTGVVHSEFNPATDEPVHFLQIWIEPDQKGYPPAYARHRRLGRGVADGWEEVLSGSDDAAIRIRQDVRLSTASLAPQGSIRRRVEENREGWLQVVSGEIEVDHLVLREGDSVILPSGFDLQLQANLAAELILFQVLIQE